MGKVRRGAVLLVAALGAIFAFALAAQAHTFEGEGDCQNWYLDLDGTYGAEQIRITTPTGIPNVTIEPPFNTDSDGHLQVTVTDTRFRETGNFTVVWDKPQGQSDVTRQVTLTREQNGCVEITVSQACGSLDGFVSRNDTAFSYTVLYNEGPVDLASASSAAGVTFPEDHNSGQVEVSVFVAGQEKDFLVGSGVPNFWDANPAVLTIETDCAPPETEPEPDTDFVCEDGEVVEVPDGTEGAYETEEEAGENCSTTVTTAPPPPSTTTEPEPPTYTCDPETGEVVEVLPGDPGYPAAVTDPSLVDCEVEVAPTTPTTQPPAPTTSVVTVDTLPFTGPADNPVALGGIALALLSIGGLVLSAARGRSTDG